MTVYHQFIVTFDQMDDADDLRLIRGDLIHEFAMFGDVVLNINGVDFGNESEGLLGFSEGMFRAAQNALLLGDDSTWNFPECDMRVLFQRDENSWELKLTLFDAGQVKNETSENGLVLLEGLARLCRDVLSDTFRRYPELLENYTFLRYFPFAFEVGRGSLGENIVLGRVRSQPVQDICDNSNDQGEEIRRNEFR